MSAFCKPNKRIAVLLGCRVAPIGPLPRLMPEVHRHKRGNIAAEAVHTQVAPHGEGIQKFEPKLRRRAVIQIDDVGPIGALSGKSTILVVKKPLGVFAREHRIRRSVVIYHIEHHLEPATMSFRHKSNKVFHGTKIRIFRPIICYGIRTSMGSFSTGLSYRLHRSQIDPIEAQRLNTLQPFSCRRKRALLGKIPYKNLIDTGVFAYHLICSKLGHFPVTNRLQESVAGYRNRRVQE